MPRWRIRQAKLLLDTSLGASVCCLHRSDEHVHRVQGVVVHTAVISEHKQDLATEVLQTSLISVLVFGRAVIELSRHFTISMQILEKVH